MTLTQLSTPLPRTQAESLVDAVMEIGDIAVSASAHEAPETGEWIFEATCEGAPDLDRFRQLARAVLGSDVTFEATEIDPAINWVARSLEGLKPVQAGGFYIHGSHDGEPAPEGLLPILIDAAEAFGTGHHETTTGCLEAIDNLLREQSPRRIIDVGTGTGVLAIALAKRTGLTVIATDIDPAAVRTAEANAKLNGVAETVLAVEATGLDHREIEAHAPYDLIVANILAGPLVDLAPAMGRMAARGCSIILSGLLETQAALVTAAYERQSIILRQTIVRNGWATLTLDKV